MSEYWKSTERYWCKHCSTYVKDTPFERKQHENTGKHQGNLKRFLRGIQNDHERNEREKEKVKAEVARLNKVVGEGRSTTNPQSLRQEPQIRKSVKTGPPSAADQKRQWAQLAEMGIEVPENFRAEMAMPGQWQTTSERVIESDELSKTLSKGVRKRKYDEDEDEGGEDGRGPESRRGWGSTTRRYPGEDQADLDALLSGSMVKRETAVKLDTQGEDESTIKSTISASHAASEHPTNISLQAETDEKATTMQADRDTAEAHVKDEPSQSEQPSSLAAVPEIPSAPVFKKRRAKVR